MNGRNVIILLIGIVLIFLSLYIFTRPAYFENWNFSDTGQIGDTIGGITAPIINLIGAFLVYISFQAQIKANEIQAEALKDEKERNSYDRIFNNYISLYESIKNHLDNIEFTVEPVQIWGDDGSISRLNHITYKGLNAINELVIRLENKTAYSGQKYQTYGTFLSFQFILKSLFELSQIVDLNIKNQKDKAFIEQNIKLMYETFLKNFAERIIKLYSDKDPYIKELKKFKEDLDNKYCA